MATQPVVLLIGRSLTLTAIAAGLRGQPELAVRQVDAWVLQLATGQAAPDAVIFDDSSAAAHVVALQAANPRVLLLEMGAGAAGDLQVTVHHSERRPLGNGHDLAALILDHAQAAAAASGAGAQTADPTPDPAGDAALATPTPDHSSSFSRSIS